MTYQVDPLDKLVSSLFQVRPSASSSSTSESRRRTLTTSPVPESGELAGQRPSRGSPPPKRPSDKHRSSLLVRQVLTLPSDGL